MATRNVAAVLAACFLVVLLSGHIRSVSADCDQNYITTQLATHCQSAVGKPIDYNGDCCNTLRNIKRTKAPDVKCMCQIFTLPLVQQFVNKEQAKAFLATCVAPSEVPYCLA